MDESLLCAGAIGDVRPKGFMPLLECQCHWGVASLHPEEACVNTLVPQDMAQAVFMLGKTFDHDASVFLAGDVLWSSVFEPAWESSWNLFWSRPVSLP